MADLMTALAGFPLLSNALGGLGGLGGATTGALSGDPAAYHQAMLDWREDRPVHSGPMSGEEWKTAMNDWRAQRPGRPGHPGPGNNNGNGPPQGFPTPVLPPQAVGPNHIPGMAGNSLYVQGMTPGASAYDLPTY